MNREDGAVFFALRDVEQALDAAGVGRASPCDRDATAAERVRVLAVERDKAQARSFEWAGKAGATTGELNDLRTSFAALDVSYVVRGAALDAVHRALGEAPESDDASLGETVATVIRELRENDERLTSRVAELRMEANVLRAEMERRLDAIERRRTS